MADRLENAVVGTKQVLRALAAGALGCVYIALDTEPYLQNRLRAACGEHGVPVETVPAMRELGALCGIEVGAACAGVRAIRPPQ
ncbi:MAG TPA: ribosomal L7Ae/L30e/S12e/Gadd45 family protein [Feifaniaceae bacterium]|nr:ribosomal L7Ae/L30e/S12e/Gadd45 family protein [Feifaniaceae bacterium]